MKIPLNSRIPELAYVRVRDEKRRCAALAFIDFQAGCPILATDQCPVGYRVGMTRANLKISFEGNNRCVQGFVCELRKLIEAMQEGDNVPRKEPKLVRESPQGRVFQGRVVCARGVALWSGPVSA
jgi:hypothetical protein